MEESSSVIRHPELIGSYAFYETLGRGAFSTVFRGVHTQLKLPVAIKVIQKTAFPLDKFLRELEILKRLDHPFCITFYEYIEDEENYYLVMEYVKGSSLLQVLNTRGKFPEWMCRHFFCQMIAAIDYLHTELHIAHRDIKIENVMIDKNNNIKMIDFGLGNMFKGENGALQTACGSPFYAPPEMFRGQSYTTSADIWSCGIVLFAMAIGRLPFEDKNIQRLVSKIVLTEPIYPDHLSPDLADLLRRLLMKDPQLRITIPQIRDNPWFNLYPDADQMKYDFGIAEHWRQTPNNRELDEDIINELRRIGYDVSVVKTDVENNSFTDYSASYKIIKRHNLYDQVVGFYQRAENVEMMKGRPFFQIMPKSVRPTNTRHNHIGSTEPRQSQEHVPVKHHPLAMAKHNANVQSMDPKKSANIHQAAISIVKVPHSPVYPALQNQVFVKRIRSNSMTSSQVKNHHD